MRSACVDIGSNTTRLLVAEVDGGRLREVRSERVFTKLRGAGPVPQDTVAALAATVAAQVRAAERAGAGEVRIVATAAVRAAANREALCAAVGAAAGVPVSVLTGEEEARLAFLGATGTLAEAPEGTIAVVDVGGGSTELVCGTVAEGVRWFASLPVGSGVLTDRHVTGDPPSEAELAAVREEVDGSFAGLTPPTPAPMAAYAVGGSATSLSRLVGGRLDREGLGRAVRTVCAAPSGVVATRLDLHPERTRVLPAGMVVLDAACGFLGIPLQIAVGGLREGVILSASVPR